MNAWGKDHSYCKVGRERGPAFRVRKLGFNIWLYLPAVWESANSLQSRSWGKDLVQAMYLGGHSEEQGGTEIFRQEREEANTEWLVSRGAQDSGQPWEPCVAHLRPGGLSHHLLPLIGESQS